MTFQGRPPLWDAHVHLPAYAFPDPVVASAEARGMKLVSVSVTQDEAAAGIRLRSLHPSVVKCFVGVHPSEAISTPLGLEGLARFWATADGIGEVGLDPKYSEVTKDSAQMRLFESQVAVAERLKKPIQVHSRNAEEACLEVLERHSLDAALLHWFEGEELLPRALSLTNTYVSFGPALLYSKKLMRMAARSPPDAVLVESDGPVPFSALGGVEGPGLVPSVAFKMAELWGKEIEDAVLQLSMNMDEYLE